MSRWHIGVSSALYDAAQGSNGHACKFALKCFALKRFALKCKHRIGLTPGRTSDMGQGQCQEKFFMVGRSVGRRGVGRRRALLDGGQRMD